MSDFDAPPPSWISTFGDIQKYLFSYHYLITYLSIHGKLNGRNTGDNALRKTVVDNAVQQNFPQFSKIVLNILGELKI